MATVGKQFQQHDTYKQHALTDNFQENISTVETNEINMAVQKLSMSDPRMFGLAVKKVIRCIFYKFYINNIKVTATQYRCYILMQFPFT